MAGMIDARELAHGITAEVRVRRWTEWRLRMRVALWLIRLAMWVGWMNVEIIEADEESWR